MEHGTVVLRLLQVTRERLVALGCDEDELDRRVPLPRGTPWHRAPFELLCELVETGLALVDDPNLGLALRLEFDARKDGVLVLMMLACPDVRSAFRRLERYQRIAFDAHRVTLEENARRVVASFPGPERPALRHLSEWMLADAVGGVHALSGEPATPLEVTFAHPRPPSGDAVEAFFGCPVRFRAPRTTLLWSEDVLRRPLVHANEVFLAAFEQQAAELIAGLPTRVQWADRVRAVILERLPDEVEMEQVAAQLRVAPRTLQRRLRSEGTSLAQLLSDVRRERSAAYLAEGRDVAEVSYLLGYASPTSFHRAFVGWYGTTPGAYREQATRGE